MPAGHHSAAPRPAPEEAPAAEKLPMIVSELGGATVAVELCRVLRIDPPQGDVDSSALRVVDLAAHWAVELGPAAAARRPLVVPGGAAPLRLLLGESLRVVSFPATALVAVPAFLRGWAKRAMVRRLVASGEEFGYVLDLARLPEITEQQRG